MKSLKAAALGVGALALAGAASPAVAAGMPAQGLVGDGSAVARSLPQAADLPTGDLAGEVKGAADGVKQSGLVKTPVFGATLPNPLNGKSPLAGKSPLSGKGPLGGKATAGLPLVK
ncbi:hypothetical protein ACWDFL_13385 [Streptomyces bungoensis]